MPKYFYSKKVRDVKWGIDRLINVAQLFAIPYLALNSILLQNHLSNH